MRVQIGDKVWDKEAINALLDTNPKAVGRALMVIYENQTESEKAAFATQVLNGVGFTGADAEWLTDIAKKWIKYGRWASERQLNAVRKAIKKYHRQILQHMLDKTDGAQLVSGRASKPAVAPAPFAQPIVAPEGPRPVTYGMF